MTREKGSQSALSSRQVTALGLLSDLCCKIQTLGQPLTSVNSCLTCFEIRILLSPGFGRGREINGTAHVIRQRTLQVTFVVAGVVPRLDSR